MKDRRTKAIGVLASRKETPVAIIETTRNVLPLDELLHAIDTLKANNVPPLICWRCERGYYAVPPHGWEPGMALTLTCECGEVIVVTGAS